MRRFCLLFCLLFISSCGDTLTEFAGQRPVELPGAEPPTDTKYSAHSKISPGAQRSDGNTVISRHSLTPTYQVGTGSTVSTLYRFHAVQYSE